MKSVHTWNFLKLQYKVYREASIFYLNATFFDVPSFSKISQPPGQNQQIDKQCFLRPLSFNITLKDTSFYIFLNSLGFFFLSRMLAQFSLTCIFHHFFESYFNLWCLHFQKMHRIYAFLIILQSSTQKSRYIEFFENLFPPRQKRWRKLWFDLSKLVYLYFV